MDHEYHGWQRIFGHAIQLSIVKEICVNCLMVNSCLLLSTSCSASLTINASARWLLLFSTLRLEPLSHKHWRTSLRVLALIITEATSNASEDIFLQASFFLSCCRGDASGDAAVWEESSDGVAQICTDAVASCG